MISLHPLGAADEDFSFHVYASTRREEMSLLDWGVEQTHAFLYLQFNAQKQHYLSYPAPAFSIIAWDGVGIGRMILSRGDEAIFLLDLTLLPEHQNAGIGTALLQDLQREAQATGKVLRLHVAKTNRAQKLYTRLGFIPVAEDALRWEMEWRAPQKMEMISC